MDRRFDSSCRCSRMEKQALTYWGGSTFSDSPKDPPEDDELLAIIHRPRKIDMKTTGLRVAAIMLGTLLAISAAAQTNPQKETAEPARPVAASDGAAARA